MIKRIAVLFGLVLALASWAGAGLVGETSSMAVSGANVYVTYTAATSGVTPTQVYVVRSQDSGAHWFSPQKITSFSTYGAISPAIAVSGPHVCICYWIYNSSTYEVQLIQSYDRGVSWTTPATLSSPAGSSFSPRAVIAGSSVMVFWIQFNQVRYTRSTDNGMTWSNVAYLYYQPTESQYDIRAAADGQRIVAAYDTAGGSENTLESIKSLDGGATWDAVPRLMATTDGVPMIVQKVELSWPQIGVLWVTPAGSTYQAMLSRSTNGGVFYMPAVQASFAASSIVSPDLSHSGASAFLVYADPPLPIESSIYFERSTDTGLTWKPAKLLSPVGHDCSESITAVTGSQVLAGYWEQVTNSEGIGLTLYLRRSTDKGVTWQPAKIIATAQIYL